MAPGSDGWARATQSGDVGLEGARAPGPWEFYGIGTYMEADGGNFPVGALVQ